MELEEYEVVTIAAHNDHQKVSAFRRGGITTFVDAMEAAKEIIQGMGSLATGASIAIYREGKMIKFYEKRLINIILKEKKK